MSDITAKQTEEPTLSIDSDGRLIITGNGETYGPYRWNGDEWLDQDGNPCPKDTEE